MGKGGGKGGHRCEGETVVGGGGGLVVGIVGRGRQWVEGGRPTSL